MRKTKVLGRKRSVFHFLFCLLYFEGTNLISNKRPCTRRPEKQQRSGHASGAVGRHNKIQNSFGLGSSALPLAARRVGASASSKTRKSTGLRSDSSLPYYTRRFFMIKALVYEIYRVALVVALLGASMGFAFLLNSMFEGVSPAAEVLQNSCCHGALPPVW
jgi:hypothetical protein